MWYKKIILLLMFVIAWKYVWMHEYKTDVDLQADQIMCEIEAMSNGKQPTYTETRECLFNKGWVRVKTTYKIKVDK